jgi:hypothetical protein
MKQQIIDSIKEVQQEDLGAEMLESLQSKKSILKEASRGLLITSKVVGVLANACDNERTKEHIKNSVNDMRTALGNLFIGLVEEHYEEVEDVIKPHMQEEQEQE